MGDILQYQTILENSDNIYRIYQYYAILKGFHYAFFFLKARPRTSFRSLKIVPLHKSC